MANISHEHKNKVFDAVWALMGGQVGIAGSPDTPYWHQFMDAFNRGVIQAKLKSVSKTDNQCWVKCPKCDGTGLMTTPLRINGSCPDTLTTDTCNLCKGQMVIKQFV